MWRITYVDKVIYRIKMNMFKKMFSRPNKFAHFWCILFLVSILSLFCIFFFLFSLFFTCSVFCSLLHLELLCKRFYFVWKKKLSLSVELKSIVTWFHLVYLWSIVNRWVTQANSLLGDNNKFIGRSESERGRKISEVNQFTLFWNLC